MGLIECNWTRCINGHYCAVWSWQPDTRCYRCGRSIAR